MFWHPRNLPAGTASWSLPSLRSVLDFSFDNSWKYFFPFESVLGTDRKLWSPGDQFQLTENKLWFQALPKQLFLLACTSNWWLGSCQWRLARQSSILYLHLFSQQCSWIEYCFCSWKTLSAWERLYLVTIRSVNSLRAGLTLLRAD